MADGQIKVMAPDEAVAHVPDGATVFVGGSGGGLQEPTELLAALGRRHRETGAPTQLTVWHCSGIGDRDAAGLSLIAEAGMLHRVVGGHWGMAPPMAKLAIEGRIEAYNLPQGAISQLLREIAGARPGLLTKIGLGTFVDPELQGGRINSRSPDGVVRRMTVDGEPLLFYPSFPIDVAFIRGSTIDERGNLTLDDEAALLEALAIAQATHASGGTVIVQAQRLAAAGSLHPRSVRVPGVVTDIACIVADQPQTAARYYDPALSGSLRSPATSIPRLPATARKVVARRVTREIQAGEVVNIGVGMPDGVASVALEEGRLHELTFAVEQGNVGGVPITGIEFGAVVNPEATIEQAAQFDFFNAGGLDIAVLGMAQLDADGNVNVSRYGDTLSGCGGFIDISQGAKRLVFCGTLTSGGLRAELAGDALRIEQEGRHRKLVREVDQVTFSSRRALEQGQPVLYVTERAVFRLTEQGLELIEIAPGIDLEKEVLELVDFAPIVNQPKLMDPDLFAP